MRPEKQSDKRLVMAEDQVFKFRVNAGKNCKIDQKVSIEVRFEFLDEEQVVLFSLSSLKPGVCGQLVEVHFNIAQLLVGQNKLNVLEKVKALRVLADSDASHVISDDSETIMVAQIIQPEDVNEADLIAKVFEACALKQGNISLPGYDEFYLKGTDGDFLLDSKLIKNFR
jgi:hypothetical protein